MARCLVCAVALLLVGSSGTTQSDRDLEEARRHLRAGHEALELEQWDEAEREFHAAIALDPRLDPAYCGLGRVNMARKRYARAVDAFVSCKSVFLGNVADRQTQRLATEQKIDEQLLSLKDYRRALETGRLRSRNLNESIRRVDDQIRQLERLQQRSLDSAPAVPPYILTALGSAHFRAGAFADAEREWRQAVATDPDIGELHNNLAVVLMLTKRYDEAEKEIQLAEKAGFRVSQGLKDDLKARKAVRSP